MLRAHIHARTRKFFYFYFPKSSTHAWAIENACSAKRFAYFLSNCSVFKICRIAISMQNTPQNIFSANTPNTLFDHFSTPIDNISKTPQLIFFHSFLPTHKILRTITVQKHFTTAYFLSRKCIVLPNRLEIISLQHIDLNKVISKPHIPPRLQLEKKISVLPARAYMRTHARSINCAIFQIPHFCATIATQPHCKLQ
jgi:hypothetical protein